VLDFTHALAGPFCTFHLGLLGAEVIKVEPPVTGDDFRAFAPTTFLAVNGGKQSVTLDLKQPAARDVLDALLPSADVVVENYRPGTAERFGLSWERLRALNPRLIFCSISGFGLAGPLRDLPAVEWSAQAAGGLAAQYISDDADPRDPGFGMLDVSTGHSALTAILAALFQRERGGTGQRIDTALIDAALMLSTARLHAPVTAEGRRERRPAVGRFRAADRRLFIMGAHQRWFAAISDVLGAPLLVEDPRFATPADRQANADALLLTLEERLAVRPAAEWEALLTARGVPAAVVRTLAEVAAHPHVRLRGNLRPLTLEDGTQTEVIGSPFFFASDGPGDPVGPVPQLGQHTDAVLTSAAIEQDNIRRLRDAGII
jgi:CoA:oxalate CoA-transferase